MSKYRFKLVSAIATVLLFASVVFANAVVASPDGAMIATKVLRSNDPEKALKNLSPEKRRAFDSVTLPIETKVTVSKIEAAPGRGNFSTLASGCWNAYVNYDWNAAAGNTVYTTWQGLGWCSNGSSVTSYWVFDRGGETSTPGWSYQGHGGQGSWNVGWEVRQYTQERFTFAVGAYGFTQTPCTQLRGGATGLYSHQSTCNLG